MAFVFQNDFKLIKVVIFYDQNDFKFLKSLFFKTYEDDLRGAFPFDTE